MKAEFIRTKCGCLVLLGPDGAPLFLLVDCCDEEDSTFCARITPGSASAAMYAEKERDPASLELVLKRLTELNKLAADGEKYRKIMGLIKSGL